jgi:predicted dinucleotide-binding enzyme
MVFEIESAVLRRKLESKSKRRQEQKNANSIKSKAKPKKVNQAFAKISYTTIKQNQKLDEWLR